METTAKASEMSEVRNRELHLAIGGGEDGVWRGEGKLSVGMAPINRRPEAEMTGTHLGTIRRPSREKSVPRSWQAEMSK